MRQRNTNTGVGAVKKSKMLWWKQQPEKERKGDGTRGRAEEGKKPAEGKSGWGKEAASQSTTINT